MANENDKPDSGSILAHMMRKTVDYTKDEKPARPKSVVKALRGDADKVSVRPKKGQTVKTLKVKPDKAPERPVKTRTARAVELPKGIPAKGKDEPDKDAIGQPYGDDRSVFARVGRDLLNKLPETGSVFDMVKARSLDKKLNDAAEKAQQPKDKDRGRDR